MRWETRVTAFVTAALCLTAPLTATAAAASAQVQSAQLQSAQLQSAQLQSAQSAQQQAALRARATSSAGHPVLGIAAGGVIQYQSAAKQNAYLKAAHDLGATWLRFDFAWSSIQTTSSRHSDWARYDRLVAAAHAHGLQVMGMIGYAPAWARDPVCQDDPYCRPRDPAEYGKFAGQVAKRYSSRGVHYWEISNEPNTAQFFKPAADPAYYTQMLSKAYTAIHAADPQAEVVTGGMAPSATGDGNYSPPQFLTMMYAAGAKGRFDILGHHPYCYEGGSRCPNMDASWSAWAQMSDTTTSLRSILKAHSDGGKQIWATEFGAPTSGGSTSMSEQQQASMLVAGVKNWSSYSWSGPLFVYSLQDRGTNDADREDWFGVLRADGSRKPAYSTLAALMRQIGVFPAGSGSGSKSKKSSAASTTTPSPTPSLDALSTAATITVEPTGPTGPTGPPPVLTGISPSQGSTYGGQVVTLSGHNLQGQAVSVWFGDRRAGSVKVTGADRVLVRVPAAAQGGTDVTVFVGDRSAQLVRGFEYRRPHWWKRFWHWLT